MIFDIKGSREMSVIFSSIPFLNKRFVFTILHFDGKSIKFYRQVMMFLRWIVITRALSLPNLAEIWSTFEAVATTKFFKILSAIVTSILCRTKYSHLFRIDLFVLNRNLFCSFDSKCISWTWKEWSHQLTWWNK